MSYVHNQQMQLQPASGTEAAQPGDGLHAHEIQDLARAANNLLWTDPCFTFAMGHVLEGSSVLSYLRREWTGLAAGGASGEAVVGMVPVMVNPSHVRQRWTLGIQLKSAGGNIGATAVHVLFANSPYVASAAVSSGAIQFLDSTRIDFVRSTWTGPIAASTDSGYVLVSGVTDGPAWKWSDVDAASFYCWAIVTVSLNGAGNPSSVTIERREFSCWGEPE